MRASKYPVEMEKQNINNRIQVQDALLPEQLRREVSVQCSGQIPQFQDTLLHLC